MATAQNIIDAAFRKIGHSDPTDTDRTDALENLNNMISSWGAEFLNHYLVRESLAVVAGDAEYTIGASGDLNTVRPISLAGAFLRDSDGYDRELSVMSGKEYNSIVSKTAEGIPGFVYFVPEYPLAKIIFDCEPDTSYTVYLDFNKNLTEFTTIATTVSLPPEYKEALVYNLAISLAEDKGIAPTQTVQETAKRTKEAIAKVRAVNSPVREARFEFGNGSAFDITTGD